MRWLAALLAVLAVAVPSQPLSEETDSEQSRKVLGSSVVTSVSVIMDHNNATKTFSGDPTDIVGTPGDLLAPDRYEFYTFDESGDLVKRLMTLDQIQGLIAGGDADGMESDASAPTYYHEVLPDVEPSDLQGVHKVVANVQNVLKSELEASRNKLPMAKPLAVLSVPDAASSWSILLPGVLGGPLESNKAPESDIIDRKPSTTTIKPEETTQEKTTENPTVIHYLPIQNIPAPPKRNLSSTVRPTTSTTPRSTTSTTTSQPNTVPVKIITRPTTIPTAKPVVSQTTQAAIQSSTSATSETVLHEMAASLSSVLSQVTNEKTPINTVESNYIPIGLSAQNLVTAGLESRPHTTKVQFTTTPFTTQPHKIQVSNKVTTEIPQTSSNKDKDKYTEIKTITHQHPQRTTTAIPSTVGPPLTTTTTELPNTSYEDTNSDISDSQLISEALAAQGIIDNSWKSETKTSGVTPTATEPTLTYSTNSDTYPTETETMEKITMIQQATTKPVSTRPKPTTNTNKATPPPAKTSPTKSNTKPSSTKPSTLSTQTKQTVNKVTPSRIQPSTNSGNFTIVSTSALNKPESTTQTNKRPLTSTNKPNTTVASSTKSKPATKKPNVKPITKPVTSTTISSKVKPNVTVSRQNTTTEANRPLSTQKDKITSISSTETAEVREDALKQSTTDNTRLDNLIESTTTYLTSLVEEKLVPTTLNYDNKTKEDFLQQSNYIASSSNKESISISPTTDAVDSTTTTILDLENEGELLQEGISAVTSILLQANSVPPVPANKFSANLNQLPVMGELKHASQIISEDTEPTTESKEYQTTILDATTEFLTDSTTNEQISTDIVTKANFNQTDEESTTDYISTTDAETININTEQPTKILNEKSTTLNISAIEFTTSVYEGTTNIPVEKDESAEKKSADYELESGGQSTQLKESKLSPESSSKGTGISSNLIENKGKYDYEDNKTITVGHKNETHKIQSLNFVGNSTRTQPNKTETNKIEEPVKNVTYNNSIPLQHRPVFKRPGDPVSPVELHPAPHENLGLEASTSQLGDDVRRFADLCNELAFRMWTTITGKGSISARSLVLSPFAVTSLLAMVFLGARGPTSGQMNDVLRLDDMITFNPHQVLQNVTESVLNSKNYGVATAAFVRQLYSDKAKGKILDFYKERAQQYYDGHVEEINFSSIGDILRRRTNLLIKRQTLGRVPEYLRGSSLSLRQPLAAFSANIFQTDCEQASIEGRDGEMYFVVRPSTRQRRLVPVPAAVWRSGFLAGYEPGLDATAVCLGADSIVSTLFVLPGQQGQIAPGDGLARLEQRLIETSYRRGGWSRLLRSLLVRPGLELQVPRFSHRSVLNVTGALQRMGLKDLFNAGRADLRGLNGLSNDLHLSDMVQINTFSTCAEDTIGARHHTETYPVAPQRMGREKQEHFPIEYYNDYSHIPLALRPRQARLPDNPRLRFDRPFLYMVRHNPTGMILHMGRFNPRLLP